MRVGLTGNIGAGKSTVARMFERLDVPVYYADQRAKRLMTTDAKLVANIRSAFGEEVYLADGSLDRAALSARVFATPAELQRLNQLVHPAVARDADRWQAAQTAPYTLHEAAILFEINSADRYDATVVVAAPEAVRKQRVMQRDGSTAAQFQQRADRQWTDRRKEAAADYLVRNGGRELLLPQVLGIDRLLRRRADALNAAKSRS